MYDLYIKTAKGRLLAEVKAANEDTDYEHDLALAQCQRDEACAGQTEPTFSSASLAKWGARVA